MRRGARQLDLCLVGYDCELFVLSQFKHLLGNFLAWYKHWDSWWTWANDLRRDLALGLLSRYDMSFLFKRLVGGKHWFKTWLLNKSFIG